MNNRICTISNLLSVARLLLTIPVMLLLSTDNTSSHLYAGGVIILAVITDFVDGILARKFHQVTEFGKFLDPFADKIAIGVVAIAITQQGKLPLWFLVMVLCRDVLIFFGGLYVKRVKDYLLQSNLIGKWTVAILAALIFFAVIDIQQLKVFNKILLAIAAVMLVVSFILYLKRFLEIISDPQQTQRP
jgi:cardiolipin synthase (CMP-forming)